MDYGRSITDCMYSLTIVRCCRFLSDQDLFMCHWARVRILMQNTVTVPILQSCVGVLLFLELCYYKLYFCWYCVGVIFFSDHGTVFWILLFGSDLGNVFLYWYWVVACTCPSCGPSKHMASETSWLHWRTAFRHTKLRLSRERLNLWKGRTREGFNSLKLRTSDCVDDSFLNNCLKRRTPDWGDDSFPPYTLSDQHFVVQTQWPSFVMSNSVFFRSA